MIFGNWIEVNLLRRQPPAHILDEQEYEAQRELISHRASAEHHKALADMYEKRIARVRKLKEKVNGIGKT